MRLISKYVKEISTKAIIFFYEGNNLLYVLVLSY
jgi:hypothetical protein